MKIRDNQHWEYEDYKQRMTKKDWAKLLLNNEDRLIFKGRMRKLVAKDLGCGIVEITKEVKKEVEKPDSKTPIYSC